MISFLLNIFYTTAGFFCGLFSLPTSIKFVKRPFAFIFQVKTFWWAIGYMKKARAMTVGHVILLGPKTEALDLEHELIHVKQYEKMPFIFPFLYYLELFKKGYKNNKYEVEAYQLAGNIYRGT